MTRPALGFFIFVILLIAGYGPTQSQAQRRSAKAATPSSTSASASQVIDFDCPEEFGYYPHPSDCTQYYVCVFGGALLESCTGGLMYSHELQTCDWPRNVGCGAGAGGELVSTVSSVKSVEPRPRQPSQLRQQQQHQQQHQQLSQQFPPPQRQLQREEAIPKHHLYTEEDLGPAEEVESDRQQRVYRGQPATLGQVARDRDGLNRHSNALQVAPATGREKLSVISFGTQQQYSRQSISPPAYVEQTTTQRVTSRGYNSSQQQQYTPSPYDPYYNIYEDDADLYKDIDYSQYTGQQNHQYQPQPQQQPTYKEKPSAVVQQQVQSPPSRKPSVQYSPPPPQPSYNTVQQDVYSGVQDYNDNYSLQDEDIDYKQSDLDLKGNRSRTSKRQETTTQASEEPPKTDAARPQRNRQLTLTAAFTFDNDKTPVTSSRQRSSINSFKVEDPPSSGPIRDTHDLVLSYIREENAQQNKTSESNAEEARNLEKSNSNLKSQTEGREFQPRIYPKPFSLKTDNLDTSQISSTSPASRGSKVFNNDDLQSSEFRIIVPSSTPRSTYEVDVDQVTLRSRLRAGIRQHPTTPGGLAEETVRPYKLPPLSRESVESSPNSQGRYRTTQKSEINQSNNQNNFDTKKSIEADNESFKFIPITPQRAPSKTSATDLTRSKEVENKSYYETSHDGRLQEQNRGNNPSSLNEGTVNNRNPNPVTRTGYSSPSGNRPYLPDIPSTVESIVKLIPIQTMRSNPSKPPSTVNDNNWLNKYRARDIASAQPKKTPNSYQVSEEISDSPNYDYLTVNEKPESPVGQSNVENNYNNKAYATEKSNNRNNYENLTTERVQQRFVQTTEKSTKNSLYSLRIDKNNGKYIGNVDGLVVATLETITNRPVSKKLNVNNTYVAPVGTENHPHQELPKIETPEVTEEEKNSFNENYEQNINNAGKNSPNNQIRIRTRGRQPTQANNNVYSSTTEPNENDPVTSVRSRNNIKLKYNRLRYSTENTLLKEAGSERTEPISPVEIENISRGVQPSEPTKETVNYNLQDDDLALNTRRRQKSNLESKIEDTHNYNKNFNEEREINHRRRQLANKNRLVDTAADMNNQAQEVNFNSEEETISGNYHSQEPNENKREKEQRYYEPPNKNEEHTRGTKSWHADGYSFSEEDDQSDDEIKQEREFNIRKMHIRKQARVTTSAPEFSTQTYENENTYSKTKKPTNSEKLDRAIGQIPNEYIVNNGEEATKKESATLKQNLVEATTGSRYRSTNNERNNINRENRYQSGASDYTERENLSFTAENVNLRVDPYSLIRPSALNDTTSRIGPKQNERVNIPVRRPSSENSNVPDNPPPLIAEEINSYFKQLDEPTPTPLNVTSTEATTVPYVMTTVERIRDKFRLGSFPKPSPPTNGFARKPSVEDNTPPPLPSDRCSQELDNESECNENTRLRVRPMNASPESQSTPGLTRGSSRNRGSATYTVSPNEADPPPRGTPASLRNRPTLKPSTSIVSKASEFIDIYRYPPSRPDPIYPTPQVDKTAAKCRKDVCLLPDCSCGGKEIPGDLPPEDTPQIVLLTFDDSVNDLNKGLYSDLFEKGRTNPNGCPISATFYVSHEWTDYSQVQNLYSTGHEIASHSVSHSFGEQFSVKKWTREIAGQREILAAYGGVKQEDIRGMRAPFLAIGGNKMFKMLYDANFTYDSSMPVYENKPPSWPYTLDYKVFHDCMIPPCPTRSYPGVWEVPMVMWQDLNGGRCSMGDACSNPPASDGVYKMLMKNFERHFTSNRSPFGLFYHAAWFTQPHHKEGFIAFLDAITKMPEVWVVTNWQAIQWVRDPTPISRLNNFAPFQCNYPERPRRCNNPKVCNLWHKSGVRYMRTCQPCPDIYPWTGKTGIRNSRVDNEIITE